MDGETKVEDEDENDLADEEEFDVLASFDKLPTVVKFDVDSKS